MTKQSDQYYTRFGFTHLNRFGKLGFLLVFAAVAWLVWEVRVSADWAGIEIDNLLEDAPAYGIALGKIIGAGLIAAYLAAAIILPRKKYPRQKFYCAECGYFLGYLITTCPRCDSNKYTINPELAARRAKAKEAEAQKQA